jgi:hypothetical protein
MPLPGLSCTTRSPTLGESVYDRRLKNIAVIGTLSITFPGCNPCLGSGCMG